MKVQLINGSPRQEGNTATALAEVAKQLKEERMARNMAWILKCTNGEKAPGRPVDEAWKAMHFIR